ncbi:phosphopantetheine-binding protein [Catellatospora methionotrophica]|uniref:phosphopantetheine-binding protein n=1 Tax=Catellatospora methionotrophica TaxID=121620 RepID=UPI0033F3FBF7
MTEPTTVPGARAAALAPYRTRLGRDLLVLRYAADPDEVDPLALRQEHAATRPRPDRFARADDLADPLDLGDPRPPVGTPYRPPATDTEAQIVDIWAEVLGLEEVGADDEFFELGGDSLGAVEAIVALTGVYGPRWRGDVPLELALLGAHTAAQIAAVLTDGGAAR